jgi:hypothetical protein
VNSLRTFQTAFNAREVAPFTKNCRMINPVRPSAAPRGALVAAVAISVLRRVVQNIWTSTGGRGVLGRAANLPQAEQTGDARQEERDGEDGHPGQ